MRPTAWATLRALEGGFPDARVVVADDGSRDATAHLALQAGAELVRATPPGARAGPRRWRPSG